jgi:hypothetical protein
MFNFWNESYERSQSRSLNRSSFAVLVAVGVSLKLCGSALLPLANTRSSLVYFILRPATLMAPDILDPRLFVPDFTKQSENYLCTNFAPLLVKGYRVRWSTFEDNWEVK